MTDERATVLVPWDEVRDRLGDLRGLRVEVYTGDDAGPNDLDDVVFYAMPYDRPYGLDLLSRMPRLRVAQTPTAGYEHVLPLLGDDVTLCNGRGLHDASTAEHALALILAAQRELPEWIREQQARHWAHRHTRSLAGSRVLIVGYGSIGVALGERLRACQAEVVPVARTPRPGVHGVTELPKLLPSADVVVLLTPLTPDTRGLLSGPELALLPDGALVVNVGRGPVLDTDALVAEASAGRLRAALDVTDPEPPPADHPLWDCPGVIITPHVAGGAADFYPRAQRFLADQVERFATGRPLRNVVRTPSAR